MKTIKQLLVAFFIIYCFKAGTSKPLFKGLSFKKNYEMEISAIPFKHISFIKEKWFPFKMFSISHDIAKREVVEDPKDENLYSVNEVIFDDEANGNFPGLLTSVEQNLDLNSDGEVTSNIAPLVENVRSNDIKPDLEMGNLATSIMQKSSVIPLSPSIIIAPSIHATGTAVQPAAIVPLNLENSKEVEVQPLIPVDPTTPIQPMHTQIDIPSVKNLEESVSKMHTDISSAVPLNTLVASPAQQMDLPLPLDVVEGPVAEVPKVVEEIKVEPIAVLPPVITSVVEEPTHVETPVVKPPVLAPALEPPNPALVEPPGKSGPVGLLMRGTRFVLYFGSVMLNLLSQMISGNPPNLNQLTEPLALN